MSLCRHPSLRFVRNNLGDACFLCTVVGRPLSSLLLIIQVTQDATHEVISILFLRGAPSWDTSESEECAGVCSTSRSTGRRCNFVMSSSMIIMVRAVIRAFVLLLQNSFARICYFLVSSPHCRGTETRSMWLTLVES